MFISMYVFKQRDQLDLNKCIRLLIARSAPRNISPKSRNSMVFNLYFLHHITSFFRLIIAE